MDLRVVALVFIGIISIQGAIPKCCVATSKHFPRSILLNVEQVEIQHSHGACEIKAVILYANGKKYCANPKVRRILKELEQIRRMKRQISA